MRKQVLGTIGVIGIGLSAGVASANSWTYLPAAGDDPAMITDGNWKVEVSVMDAEAHTLRVVNNSDESKTAVISKTSGSTLDLRGEVTDESGDSWTIARIGGWALGTSASGISTFYSPGTLGELGFGGQIFRAGLETKIVVDEPEMTGIIANNTFISVHVTDMLLRVPKVVALGGSSGAFPGDFIQNTDVSNWDLGGVKYFVGGGAAWNSTPTANDANGCYFFRNKKFSGTLRLPSILDVPASAFMNCPNMSGLELGTNNLMKSIGAGAATNCASLARVVLGGAQGWTLGAQAFHSPNVTNVVFVGAQPTMTSFDEIVFGMEDTAAKTILFEIPRHDATWNDCTNDVREATAAERQEFAARYGAGRLDDLIGIVPPNVFKTAQVQYLAWCGGSPRTYTIDLTLDPNHPEHAIVVTPEKASYAAGESVTIAPVAGQEVAYWWGDVPKESCRATSLKLTIDRDIKLRPLFRNRWTVSTPDPLEAGAAVTITDGIWTFNASVRDAEKRTLTLGNGTEGGLYAAGNSGAGLINLLGTFREGGLTGREWTVTDLGVFKTFQTNSGPTGLYAPETVVWNAQAVRSCKTLSVFALVATNAVGVIGNNNFYDNSLDANLTTMLLAAPGLTGLGFNSANGNFISKTDVSEWDVSGLQGIGINNPLTDTGTSDFFKNKKFKGVLDIPAIKWIGPKVLAGTSGMTGLKLGAKRAMTRIYQGAVSNATALVSVEIGGASNLQIDGQAFYAPKLREVKFLYGVPTLADDGIVFGTDDTPALSMAFKIRAARRSAWKSVIETAREATEDEKARFRLCFGDDAYLAGVVPATTFRTAQEQYLVVGGPNDQPRGLILLIK